jgi:thioesterase domain-containing protein
VLPNPGYTEGEPLPASVAALVRAHARAIRRAAGEPPFVLAGHSSGGLAAHALATYLETLGRAPAALVLMDVYPAHREEMSEQYWSLLPSVIAADNPESSGDADDVSLIATAHYFSMDWRELDVTSIPTLLVRAEGRIGKSPITWPFADSLTVVDVPGSHFTMMADDVVTTAQAVSEWLADL